MRGTFVRLTIPATLALTVITGVHAAAVWAQEGGGGAMATGGAGGEGGDLAGGQGGTATGSDVATCGGLKRARSAALYETGCC